MRVAGQNTAIFSRTCVVSTKRGIRLHPMRSDDILVSMTRTVQALANSGRAASPPGHWLLQDAKARFSELVRRVRSEGPQHVTVHGRDEVVVIAAEEFRRLQGLQTGRALVEVLQAAPYPEIDLATAPPIHAPVRDVAL